MATNWNDADAVCPFYHTQRTSQRVIICESIYPDSICMLRLNNTDDFNYHFETYCCCEYQKCELYKAVCKSSYKDFTEG